MPHIIKTAIASLVFALAGTTASAEISDPDGVIYDFDIDMVFEFLVEKNFSPEILNPGTEKAYVYAVDPSTGLNFYLLPSCDEYACTGLEMIAEIANSDASYERVNYANSQFIFLDVYRTDANRVFSTRYEICDFGFKRSNLELSLDLLLRLSGKVQDKLVG